MWCSLCCLSMSALCHLFWVQIMLISVRLAERPPFGKELFAHLTVRSDFLFEPRHEKTNVLHMRKQRSRSASRYIVFAT